MITAREAAVETLYEVIYNGAYSNLALKSQLKKNADMPSPERALLTNLVYGVVSRHHTLIYLIRKYSTARLGKIERHILIILQLGLYQLLYTDKIPESAAVNESVKLAKKYDKRASGFVNAILRSFIRDGKRIDYPETEPEKTAIKYSYSAEMAQLFINNFGAERAERIMAALNEAPRLCLRANILKTNAAELKSKLNKRGIKAEELGGALIAASGFDIGADELYKNGLCSVQDEAAYNAALVLDPREGETIIDMCAAPGGKTTHIAELIGDRGTIIACDIYEHKLKLINSAAIRLGLSCISTRIADGTQADKELIAAADRVLCDVPCSGLGIIRRKPDIKLGKTDISELPILQRKILDTGAAYCKSGAALVYSTCTINRAENEGVTDAFLNANSDFIKKYEKTFLPDTDSTDGFYICKMERK